MRCASCGGEVPEGASFCPNCGVRLEGRPAPGTLPEGLPAGSPSSGYVQPPAAVVPAQTDGGAVAALVIGIASFFVCPLVGGIVAIVLGRSSERRIAASRGALTGEGLARAGVILGWINVVLGVLLLIIWAALISILAGLGRDFSRMGVRGALGPLGGTVAGFTLAV